MKRAKRRAVRLTEPERELIHEALEARKRAYAPYSRFKVGAALRTVNGTIATGCNVENASFGATVCAERNAVAQSLVLGAGNIRQLAIATDTSPPSAPCGLCRQVLAEFCDNLSILLANPQGEVIRTTLRRLLPDPFSGKSL
jgi:cytidine deaminase